MFLKWDSTPKVNTRNSLENFQHSVGFQIHVDELSLLQQLNWTVWSRDISAEFCCCYCNTYRTLYTSSKVGEHVSILWWAVEYTCQSMLQLGFLQYVIIVYLLLFFTMYNFYLSSNNAHFCFLNRPLVCGIFKQQNISETLGDCTSLCRKIR